MAKKQILFVSQEIAPYLPGDPLAQTAKSLLQGAHQNGFEVRTFMPKYGAVNERRNQLHEVIRLSGMNIPIDDSDHPLIIKVASLQPSRIQVYFIDSDDYFQKSEGDEDAVGSNRDDNDERSIFFARGTMETVRKLRWEPGVISCTGWITSLVPMYLKLMYADDPSFVRSKIVYTVEPGEITGSIDPRFFDKLAADNVPEADLKPLRDMPLDTNLFHRFAIRYADGVIFATEPDPGLLEDVEKAGIPFLAYEPAGRDAKAYTDFFNSLTEQ